MLNSMNEICEIIKDVIAQKQFREKGTSCSRIKSSDVAKELGTTPGALATSKSRNKIMYKEVAEFAARNMISINFLLFGQDANSLVKASDQLMMNQYGIAS